MDIRELLLNENYNFIRDKSCYIDMIDSFVDYRNRHLADSILNWNFVYEVCTQRLVRFIKRFGAVYYDDEVYMAVCELESSLSDMKRVSSGSLSSRVKELYDWYCGGNHVELDKYIKDICHLNIPFMMYAHLFLEFDTREYDFYNDTINDAFKLFDDNVPVEYRLHKPTLIGRQEEVSIECVNRVENELSKSCDTVDSIDSIISKIQSANSSMLNK